MAERKAGYIKLSDAAVYTSMSVKTLRRLIAQGELPAYRRGRLIYLRPADLDALFRRIPNAKTR